MEILYNGGIITRAPGGWIGYQAGRYFRESDISSMNPGPVNVVIKDYGSRFQDMKAARKKAGLPASGYGNYQYCVRQLTIDFSRLRAHINWEQDYDRNDEPLSSERAYSLPSDWVDIQSGTVWYDLSLAMVRFGIEAFSDRRSLEILYSIVRSIIELVTQPGIGRTRDPARLVFRDLDQLESWIVQKRIALGLM